MEKPTINEAMNVKSNYFQVCGVIHRNKKLKHTHK